MRRVKVAIIGAGSAGLYALGPVRKQTDDFLVVDGGALGTTCARVGCMPSKVLIQIAEDLHRGAALAEEGIGGGDALSVDLPQALAHVRRLRDGFVGNILPRTEALGERLLRGNARFVAPHVLEVEGQDAPVEAERFVLAVGSRPVVPEPWRAFADRLLTTDTLFEQETLPRRMGVLGLGVIGLEMGQALARLGIEVTGVDLLETVGGITDPRINAALRDALAEEFPLWLGAAAELEEGANGALRLRAGGRETEVDKVLVSLGRRSNLDRLNLAAWDLSLDDRGLPVFDPETMQIADRPLFLAGDATAERPVLHEAGDEGRIAGFNAVRETPRRFRRKTPLVVTFTDPNIASVGADWRELEGRDDVIVGERDFATQSRARVMGKNRGLLRVYARRSDGLLLGAAMAMPKGEDIAHLLAWAVQSEMTVFDLLRFPFYHPVIEEGLQNALYAAAGRVAEKPAPPIELVAVS